MRWRDVFCLLNQLNDLPIEGSSDQLENERSKLGKCSLAFAISFAGGWPRDGVAPYWLHTTDLWVHIQHHLRCFHFGDKMKEDAGLQTVRCQRIQGSILSASKNNRGRSMNEVRYSVAVNTETCSVMPIFVVVTLCDSAGGSSKWGSDIKINKEGWKSSGLLPSNYYRGVATFQYTLYTILDQWAKRWNETLREMDNILQVQASSCTLVRARLPKADVC
jgi:hypothetical protein